MHPPIAELRPSIERLIAAIREALRDERFNLGLYEYSGTRSVVTTTAAPEAAVLPRTQKPVRGTDAVTVHVSDASRPSNRLSKLLSHALDALTEHREARWPDVRAAFIEFADAAYNVPVLGRRMYEAFGYKYHDVADLEALLASRGSNTTSDALANIEAEWILFRAVERGFSAMGFQVSSQISSVELAELDGWGRIPDFILDDLSALADISDYVYHALVYLNGPLIDMEKIVLVDLGWNDGLLLRDQITLSPASDEDLALAAQEHPTPARLPYGVQNSNTILRFTLALSADAPVEEYRRLYPFAVDVAIRVLDAIRLVAGGDLGISYVKLISAADLTPAAPTNYAWEYQPEYAVYIPRRTVFKAPSVADSLAEESVVILQRLVLHRLGETDLKGFPVAIRRFRDSYERYDSEDPERLLDLAIALEALFLNDEDTKEQLRFRLSLRIARFLEPDPDARIPIFRSVRDLYDMRSKLAHGATVHSLKTKDKTRLLALQAEAPTITRRAIAKMIEGDGPTGLKESALREWWLRLELS